LTRIIAMRALRLAALVCEMQEPRMKQMDADKCPLRWSRASLPTGSLPSQDELIRVHPCPSVVNNSGAEGHAHPPISVHLRHLRLAQHRARRASRPRDPSPSVCIRGSEKQRGRRPVTSAFICVIRG
jgi:hypothetical protein